MKKLLKKIAKKAKASRILAFIKPKAIAVKNHVATNAAIYNLVVSLTVLHKVNQIEAAISSFRDMSLQLMVMLLVNSGQMLGAIGGQLERLLEIFAGTGS